MASISKALKDAGLAEHEISTIKAHIKDLRETDGMDAKAAAREALQAWHAELTAEREDIVGQLQQQGAKFSNTKDQESSHSKPLTDKDNADYQAAFARIQTNARP